MKTLSFNFAIREDLKDVDLLPKLGTNFASGWDVKAAFPDRKHIVLNKFDKYLIPLGFRVFCPEGWWLELRPRSSTFVKKSLHCLYGVIDNDYEGECKLAVQYIPQSEEQLIINFGDSLAQMIPVKRKVMIVNQVSNEQYDWLCAQRNYDRKNGGFGSTGA